MCEIDFDGERPTVWHEHLVTRARKEHDCDSCGGDIAIGESYLAHFSVFDGDSHHEKQCLRCRTISNAFHREHGTTVNPASLLDFLEQCLDEERWVLAIEDDDDVDDNDGKVPRNRLPSQLSDEGLRWKYAMVEIRARNAAARAA